jgi:hypothetical protein
VYDSIPDDYKAGVDGLVVSREAPAHPTLPDVFTLGECRTEDYAVDWSGPDTTRSVVVLYWGAFKSLADRDPDFDWEEEVWETLTHELRHHLESLAREDELEGMDYAVDETFKRDEGLDFDPWYYQHGEEAAPGVYRVERNLYLEQQWSEQAFAEAPTCGFTWLGTSYVIPRPAELGDVHFVWIHGVVEPPETFELVLVRRRTWWEDAKRLLGVRRPVILESEAQAEPIAGRG